MNIGGRMARYSMRHPWVITLVMVQATLILGLLAALPSLWPQTFSALPPVKVDTDPENMLPADEPVRVFHDQMKEEMALHDMMVIGVVNETDPQGVFNPESLRKVYELTQFAENLRWEHPEKPEEMQGVIPIDMIAPSTVDNIEQGEQGGQINFEWLMRSPPETEEGAQAVRDKAQRIPFLNGTLLSEDGQALAIYLPLTSKDMSSRIYSELKGKIAEFDGDEQWHITGLPVAEDVFGVQMFKQMAISAPVAMVVIFLLMLFFFRNVVMVISPMIVALVCTVITMGLLVVTGSTVHIMSSMIPIFIMPIAVLDAVHILSEFFDRYPESHDRESAMTGVMDTLFVPMLYTSITTAVGFGSLALVPIPPVQVFGVFIAFGVIMAWIWTITFIPAFVRFIPSKRMENFGANSSSERGGKRPLMERVLSAVGVSTYRYAKVILTVVVIVFAVAVYGITQIRINDNPIRWFTKDHPIRVADRVLNEHFGGTYMAYLTLTPEHLVEGVPAFAEALVSRLNALAEETADIEAINPVTRELRQQAQTMAKSVESPAKLLDELELYADTRMFEGPEEQMDAWDRMMTFLASESGRLQLFKQPEVLAFMEDLRAHMLETGIVGKVNALPDIVKTVNRELFSGEEHDFRIPDSSSGVAQTLLQYQNSHRPQDLWHFVTPDYRQAVLWLQLKSGDNRDMESVVDSVEQYMDTADFPLGARLDHRWFGLTYINVIWQDKMVAGMLRAFLGSFVIVFVMMTILYRSALWGLLSMVPLTVTIALIYGMIGLVGKDYDMPVAVLSSLSLGLAIDYAIHFLSRSRAMYVQHGAWRLTAGPVFDEPARAITRNAIVIGVGFLPLLAAPLMPYKTVGVFIAAILVAAGLASLLILPALISLLEPLLFPRSRKCCLVCNCVTCIITSIAAVVAVIVNVGYLLTVGWTVLSWASLLLVVVLSQACYFISKTKLCRTVVPMANGDTESNSSNQPEKGEESS